MSSKFEEFMLAHERLKKRIHAFRIPIKNKAGLYLMGTIYVTVPLAVGYVLFNFTNYAAKKNLGENYELLREKKKEWQAAQQAQVVARRPDYAAARASKQQQEGEKQQQAKEVTGSLQ